MQEILFWLIVIPVMCAIGAILTLRSHRNDEKPDNSTKSTTC